MVEEKTLRKRASRSSRKVPGKIHNRACHQATFLLLYLDFTSIFIVNINCSQWECVSLIINRYDTLRSYAAKPRSS